MVDTLVSVIKRRLFYTTSDPFVMSFPGSFHFRTKINDSSNILCLKNRCFWNKKRLNLKTGCRKGPRFNIRMLDVTTRQMLLVPRLNVSGSHVISLYYARRNQFAKYKQEVKKKNIINQRNSKTKS
jgi:hypothetical protein